MRKASIKRSLSVTQLGLAITTVCRLGKSCSYAAFKPIVCPENHLLDRDLPECPAITSMTGFLSTSTVLWRGLYHGDFGAEYVQWHTAAHNSKEIKGR